MTSQVSRTNDNAVVDTDLHKSVGKLIRRLQFVRRVFVRELTPTGLLAPTNPRSNLLMRQALKMVQNPVGVFRSKLSD